MMGSEIRVRRVYEQASPEDGARVLVDRLWPRGLRKDAARLDEWAKDVAPSSELRTWYQHDPAKLDEFRRRYTAELAQPGPREALARLRSLAEEKPVTLLTATKDLALSHAPILAELAAGERLAGRYRRPISCRLRPALARQTRRVPPGGRCTSWVRRTVPGLRR